MFGTEKKETGPDIGPQASEGGSASAHNWYLFQESTTEREQGRQQQYMGSQPNTPEPTSENIHSQ
jgi:hypothetical protein